MKVFEPRIDTVTSTEKSPDDREEATSRKSYNKQAGSPVEMPSRPAFVLDKEGATEEGLRIPTFGSLNGQSDDESNDVEND